MSQQKSDYVTETEIDAALDELPTDAAIEETANNLEANGFDVVVDSAERPSRRFNRGFPPARR